MEEVYSTFMLAKLVHFVASICTLHAALQMFVSSFHNVSNGFEKKIKFNYDVHAKALL